MSKGWVFFRRISALYLFFLVLAVFVLLFYYKYIPDNKEELNQRGHRILTQLVENFVKKDQDFQGIINSAVDSVAFDSLLHKAGPYSRLNANIPYDCVALPGPAQGRSAPSPDLVEASGLWRLVYRHGGDTLGLSVKLQDFASPFLSAREDIFQNYLLLKDGDDNKKGGSLHILFSKTLITTSGDLDADTLQNLTKNTDKSALFNVTIGGEPYVLLSTPFEFHGQHLTLAGLIDHKTYDQKVQSTPLYFLSLSIIFISLLLISLPFLKAYLLSPKESISSRDVLKTAISFYIGSAVITFVLFYSFLIYVTHLSLQNRLMAFSNKIKLDVERDLDQADRQLAYYDSTLGSKPVTDNVKRLLATSGVSSEASMPVDSICSPRIFSNVSRLIWIDTNGKTIAKWSPFIFNTPFTSLKGFDFFTQLIKKPAYFSGIPGTDFPVVYPGKSNLTDEFQTFIARASHSQFPAIPNQVPKGDSIASFIALAAQLQISNLPVIPNGFSFCVIDIAGKVLIDADAHRNLGENLFSETGHDPGFVEVVRHQRNDITLPLELYGEPCVVRVTPIDHQPLYLVAYYDQKIVTANIFRFMHFSIQTLLYIWLGLVVCLLLSTYEEWKPMLLRFNLNKMEWVRPTANDQGSRLFSVIYFFFLFVMAVVFYLGIALFSQDLNDYFYIALLLPFYTLAGVQLSRITSPGFWSYVVGCIYPLTAIITINIIIVLLVCNTKHELAGFIVPFLFQVIIALFLFRCCKRHPMLWRFVKDWDKEQKHTVRQYLSTLYLSILLIGVLPTLGILTYGFYAEKIQYKKQKMADLGTSFFNRSNALLNNSIPSYKPDVLEQLSSAYQDSLIFHRSIYLTDHDALLDTDAIVPYRRTVKEDYLPDGLYSLIMDNVYQAAQIWGDQVSIQDTSGSLDWYFQKFSRSRIRLVSTRPVGNAYVGRKYLQVECNLQKPHSDFLLLPPITLVFFFLLLVGLVFLANKLIAGVVNRLFLLNFVDNGKIRVDAGYLADFFKPEDMPRGDPYLKNLFIPLPFTVDFFDHERTVHVWGRDNPVWKPVDYILALADYFEEIYSAIWLSLTPEEQYVLFDFSNDRYTNYKNSTILFKLINKGILRREDHMLDLFSLSFRQYVQSMKDTTHIQELKSTFSISGTWANIRIPVLSIIGLVAIFLFKTQAEFTGAIVAGLTSLSALVPMVLRLFSKQNGST